MSLAEKAKEQIKGVSDSELISLFERWLLYDSGRDMDFIVVGMEKSPQIRGEEKKIYLPILREELLRRMINKN